MKFVVGEKVSVCVMGDMYICEIINFNFGESRVQLKFPHGGTFWENTCKISKVKTK